MAAKQTMATGDALEAGRIELAVTFLSQGEQRAEDVARKLAGYIAGAERSLDLALYDVR